MSTLMDEEIKRWTAKRETALVSPTTYLLSGNPVLSTCAAVFSTAMAIVGAQLRPADHLRSTGRDIWLAVPSSTAAMEPCKDGLIESVSVEPALQQKP